MKLPIHPHQPGSRNSLPNLYEVRSDMSTATPSAATTSRLHRCRRHGHPGRRATALSTASEDEDDEIPFHAMLELARVTGNFDFSYTTQYGTGQGSYQLSSHEGAPAISYPETQKALGFHHVPLMLLPKARPRNRIDILDYLSSLSTAVIPLDPRTPLILSASPQPPASRPNTPTAQSADEDSSDSSESLPEVQPTAEHLESFVREAHRHRRVQKKRHSMVPSLLLHDPDCRCPKCEHQEQLQQQAKMKETEEEDVVGWYEVPTRTGATKLNNVHRGIVPIYKKLSEQKTLHERTQEVRIRHQHPQRRASTAGPHPYLERARPDTAGSNGTEGRPGSPSSLSSIREDDESERIPAGSAVVRVPVHRLHWAPSPSMSPSPLPSPLPTLSTPAKPTRARSSRVPPVRSPSADTRARTWTLAGPRARTRDVGVLVKVSPEPAEELAQPTEPTHVPEPPHHKKTIIKAPKAKVKHERPVREKAPPRKPAEVWGGQKVVKPTSPVPPTPPPAHRSPSPQKSSASTPGPPTPESEPVITPPPDSHPVNDDSTLNKPKRQVKKKERRPSEPKAPKEVQDPPDPPSTEEANSNTPPPDRGSPPPKDDPARDIVVPGLPRVRKKADKPPQRKLSSRASGPPRSFIKFPLDPEDDVIEQQIRTVRPYKFMAATDKNDHPNQKAAAPTWQGARLALSQQSSRFELPMDMRLLENMTPTQYLTKYCVVTSKRQWLYEKIYLKHKDGKIGQLTLKGLEKALKEALVDTVTPEEVRELCVLAQLDESSKINQKMFIGIASMAERYLYPKFLTEDTLDIKEHKKEKIECADFCGLEWKFHGVDVNPHMKKLLEML